MLAAPPALSSLIDIRAFYSRYSTIAGRSTNSKEGKEWHGSCPRCGGTDRFSFWESGRFSCSLRSSGCGIHGSSPYWFLRDVEGLSHRQACDDLGIGPADYLDSVQLPALPFNKDTEPCSQWQESAERFVWRSERCLWSSLGKRGLDYLHTRGLTDTTIKAAHLGFCPGWFSDSLVNWGLPFQTDEATDMKIPEGIILPWYMNGKIWKIAVRRPDRSYFQVFGSSDALYNVDSFQPGRSVCLLEGEFDALSVHQDASDLVAAIATGGSSKGRFLSQLQSAATVLVAFDRDPAGESGAQIWLDSLPQAIRWTPWAHDANEMLQQQLPIHQWVELGLTAALAPPLQESEKESTTHLGWTCGRCGRDEQRQREDGRWLCVCYWNPPPLPTIPILPKCPKSWNDFPKG